MNGSLLIGTQKSPSVQRYINVHIGSSFKMKITLGKLPEEVGILSRSEFTAIASGTGMYPFPG